MNLIELAEAWHQIYRRMPPRRRLVLRASFTSWYTTSVVIAMGELYQLRPTPAHKYLFIAGVLISLAILTRFTLRVAKTLDRRARYTGRAGNKAEAPKPDEPAAS